MDAGYSVKASIPAVKYPASSIRELDWNGSGNIKKGGKEMDESQRWYAVTDAISEVIAKTEAQNFSEMSNRYEIGRASCRERV